VARLTDREVKNAKPGKYGDGGGLQLVVSKMSAGGLGRKWVFRFLWHGKAREMGLGIWPDVKLADAREKATAARRLVKGGTDPISAKRKDRGVPTFGKLADEVLAELSAGFRSAQHREQWRVAIERYCSPIRNIPVDQIDTNVVLSVLKPHWTRAPETASRLRGRIEKVLNAAKAKGFRTGENPAQWRGHLENLLPRQSRLLRGHYAAMAYADVPTFLARLREHRSSIAAMALEFAILTAARSGEARGARWSEVDLDAGVWTIPPDRMKAGREHRVPMSAPAMAILAKMNDARTGDLVFPGQRPQQPLSPASMDKLMRKMKIEDATVHGFRSSFRDWCGNETLFQREIAEQALAHAIGDKAEQAYRRSDALEKRRALMEAWGKHCAPREAGDNVTPLRRA
jgi:integrase